MHGKEKNGSTIHMPNADQEKTIDQQIMEVVVTTTDESKRIFIFALQQLIAAQETSLCDRQKSAEEGP